MHALTQNVNKDVRNLGHVIEMLEENPQSLIFGNPEVRPGPGEAGFKTNP
jgi:phospholipid/cholesterol/gamma-HCH transport system substrate-binding protein